ncbi:MAG: NAD(P)H-dependent flavin oxidoreductase, partial [Burkholderiales bacterium]
MNTPREIFRNLRVPVVGAPMFLVSGPELVIEQCKAGIVGSFPALNARPQEQLEAWLTQIDTTLARHRRENPGAIVAPYAVNLIVNPANKRLEQDFEVCVRHKVPIIITSLHAPTAIAKRVHDYGGMVFHDVVRVRHAEKAIVGGVDGIILVCAGAGGHAG